MMFFMNANPHPRGTHEFYIEEIRRLTDVKELVGGMSADIDLMTKRRQDMEAVAAAATSAANSGASALSVVAEQQQQSQGMIILTPAQSDMFSCRLARLKELLYDHEAAGDGGQANTAYAVQTAQMFVQKYPSFFPRALRLMPTPSVPFEARKNIAAVFNVLLTGSATKELFGGTYTYQHYHEIMAPICAGFDSQKQSPDTALLCGTMYRSTLRYVIPENTVFSLSRLVPYYDRRT
jgi:hypothetical protein